MRHHIVSFVALPAALLCCAVLILWYTDVTNATIATMNRNGAAQSASQDVAINAFIARKAAELQVQQEAAARATAESAKTADVASAATVDSSTCNTAKTHNNPDYTDVVVNKKHCMRPVAYVPADLVDVGSSFLLSAKAAGSYMALIAAATDAGEPLALTSTYRSYSAQVATYAYWVNVSGKDGADTYSARPGYSEHQTGLAFDVADADKKYVLSNFAQTSQYQWLLTHAADYGFIQRYYAGSESITGYQAEEWHYRFVGITTAIDMRAKGIKTLEQYWGVNGGNYY